MDSAAHCRGLTARGVFSPQYRHLLLLLGWAAYFVSYILTERLIPLDRCRPVACPLDARIPFCEWFVIPYVSWYGLIAVSLGYFLLRDVPRFCRLQLWIMAAQAISVAVYILMPTRQELRPAVFPRENLLTGLLSLLYAADTSTGVCPSLHVSISVGLASAWLRSDALSRAGKCAMAVWCALICASVAFVKQHSVMDIAAAIPVCLAAEWLVYGKRVPAKDSRARYTSASDGA